MWKLMLVSFTHAFDHTAISHLVFLQQTQDHPLLLSGDGVFPFVSLIAAGLASYQLVFQDMLSVRYIVQLAAKGSHIIEAWCSGDREAIKQVLHDLARWPEQQGDQPP